MKHPRQKSDHHLDFVRSLPCINCGDNTSTEAAHIRMPAPWAGKRSTGMGEKPDDSFTVPLCGRCHRKQHEIGERRFWCGSTVDEKAAIIIALALWKASGDYEIGEQIVREWRG